MGDMLPILVAVLAFVSIGGVGLVVASAAGGANPRPSKRAQAMIQNTRSERAGRASRGGPVDAGQRRKQIAKSLRDQERKKRAAMFDISAKIYQAGLTITLRTFWLFGGGFGVVAATLVLAVQHNLLVALMVGLVGGAGLPIWVLGVLAKRRAAKFAASFADAVDIIVRGVRSGLPLHDCLKMIGKECPEPLAGEFRRLNESLTVGGQLDQALEKMYERIPTPELRFFIIVLNIQQKTGGNLGEALGNLSIVVRGRRMMREKIKALSSEAVSSAGVIGCLPPGVAGLVQLTSPTYLSPMFTDQRGHMMLGVAAVIMTIGTLVMRKMINFKF